MLEGIRKDAKTARWTGILLIVAGILALIAPFVAGLSVAIMVGALLAVAGISQLVLAFRAGSFGPGLGIFLLGVLSLVAGLYMVSQPAAALAALTLFLAAYFIATGVLQGFYAISVRPADGWGWLLVGGLVSLLLGLLIWAQFPLSGVWAVGVLVGVHLLMSGWMLVAVGSVAGRLAKGPGV